MVDMNRYLLVSTKFKEHCSVKFEVVPIEVVGEVLTKDGNTEDGRNVVLSQGA